MELQKTNPLNVFNGVTLILSGLTGDGELIDVKDCDTEKLCDVFIKAGINITKKLDKYLKEVKNKNLKDDYNSISNEMIFDFCQFLEERGYLIFIREEASQKNRIGYNNIRLYIPERYEEYEQSIILDQICRRFFLRALNTYDKNGVDELSLTIYLGNSKIMDHQQLNSVENLQKITHFISLFKNGILVVPNESKIYWAKGIEELNLKDYGYQIQGLSKKQNLVYGNMHDFFIESSNPRALYIPKDIYKSKQQILILNLIFKELEYMKKFDKEIPKDFSLDIFVDGKFLMRMTEHSFNMKNDWNAELIMDKVKAKIDMLNIEPTR